LSSGVQTEAGHFIGGDVVVDGFYFRGKCIVGTIRCSDNDGKDKDRDQNLKQREAVSLGFVTPI